MTLAITNLARPPLLAPVTLALPPASVTGLIGPNGAGKTTLLRAIAGLSAGPGTVTIDGAPLAAATRVRTLAWLPADRDVAWPMQVADLVQLGLGPGAARDDAAITAALIAVDAEAFADRRVDTLSTGERARVLLARALVARPRWLLLDEPVANLDPFHRLGIMALLGRLAATGTGVVIALHDLDLARRHCDRLLLLDMGALVATGTPAAVLGPAHLAAVFRIRTGPDGWEAVETQSG